MASTSAGSSRSKLKSSSGGSRSHHASLSIAQIQRELKRGEMVQVSDLTEKILMRKKLCHLQFKSIDLSTTDETTLYVIIAIEDVSSGLL